MSAELLRHRLVSPANTLWPKRKTLFSFSDLADLCTVGAWLERGLPMEKAYAISAHRILPAGERGAGGADDDDIV